MMKTVVKERMKKIGEKVRNYLNPVERSPLDFYQKKEIASLNFIGANAFGKGVVSPCEAISEPEVGHAVWKMLIPAIVGLGVGREQTELIVAKCLMLASECKDVGEYERRAHELLDDEGVTDGIPRALRSRAEKMVGQISSHLNAGYVCDYGCGDARVGKLLAKNGMKVSLSDVYKHGNVASTGLRFDMLSQVGDAPYPAESFDNTLALTVYHHSDDPLHVLDETARITKKGGKVIAIESVYGVLPGMCPDPIERELAEGPLIMAQGEGFFGNVKLMSDKEKEMGRLLSEGYNNYIKLGSEQQRLVNIFFDHFYNRVIHYSADAPTKVNVPYNFNTPENWAAEFEKRGFSVEMIHLGIDQPAVPEYHVLIVATKL